MALTHKVTTRIDLPHEPGQWIEARLPSKLILDRAEQARQRRAAQMARDFGADMFQALRGLTVDAAEREAAPGDSVDWYTLLTDCITAWSYDEPVSADAIGGLDAETVDVVLAALLPRRRTDDERKNGSYSSISASTATDLRPASG